jgi:hypothetical protein
MSHIVAVVVGIASAACVALEDPGEPDHGATSEALGVAPAVGAEVAIDLPVAGFTGAPARHPDIAWSGAHYLVVWQDDRCAACGSQLHAARVNGDGIVVDRSGIRVADVNVADSEPAVAWTGAGRLVVWTRQGDRDDVAAAVISPTAQVTQLGTIAGSAAIERSPSVAATAGGALVVWQAGGNVRGRIVSGTVLGVPFDIATAPEAERYPVVAASAGGSYLVAYEWMASDIRGQLVTGAGALIGSWFAISNRPAREYQPALTFNGTDFVVAWRDDGGPGPSNEIMATRVTTAGVVRDLGADGLAGKTILPAEGTQPRAVLACDETSCLVAADLADSAVDVSAQRTALDLSLLGAPISICVAPRAQRAPAFAARSSGFMAVWEDQRTTVSAVIGARIDGAGAVLDPGGVVVNRSAVNAEVAPAYTRGTTTQLVVWSDARRFGNDIMARRFDAAGVPLDTSALAVSNASAHQSAPSVAFDGTRYLVVWADGRFKPGVEGEARIFSARFQEDGTLLDPAGVLVDGFSPFGGPTNLHSPRVASITGNSLVVADGASRYAAHVAADGTVIPVELCQAGPSDDCENVSHMVDPAVVWDPGGGRFVLVWSARFYSWVEPHLIMRSSVTRDGIVLTYPPAEVAGSSGFSARRRPSLAASGSQILMVWEAERTDGTRGIYGARYSASSGVIETDIPIATGTVARTSPTVVGVSDGRWAIAWVDASNEATTGLDIHGATMLPTGVLEGADYVISAGAENETEPAFQTRRNARRRADLAYQKEAPDLISRVMRRAIVY